MKTWVSLVTIFLLVFSSPVAIADKVVVIPMGGTDYPAQVNRTGQARCTYFDGADWHWDNDCTNAARPPGQDGELQPGVTWPNPRFSDNDDGTVTDNLTGLIWLRDANCNEFFTGDATGQNRRDWNSALSAANQLANGYCGLTDNSAVGDWRVPTIYELLNLGHRDYYDPALSNAAGTDKWSEGDAFFGAQSSHYWSSTSSSTSPYFASAIRLYYCAEGSFLKSSTLHLWPVRGGQ